MRKQLFFLLTLYLILTLKAEETKIEEDINETILDTTYTDKTNDTITIIEQYAPVEPLPNALVVLPIRRTGTAEALVDAFPCGGIAKKKTGTLTPSQSLINIIWEIRIPAQNGNCTVKLSPGLDNETNFFNLFPSDGSANVKGEFPCGRIQGFDSKQFKLPENYDCDQCTLQWKWMTPKGNYYSCSDVTINGMTTENCMARCNNGGACFNGKCICLQEFYGEFCEHSYNESTGAGWIIFILVLLIALIAGGVYVFTRNKDSWLNKTNFSAGMENQFNEGNKQPIIIKS